MGAGHGERLSTVDSAFLSMETPFHHMHTAGLFVFDAANADAFTFTRFVDLVRSRLGTVPRLRQKLAFTPLSLGNPVWVDDLHFDLGYHVRHAALPKPGTDAQLREYAARLVGRQLDRDRPLWEMYVIEGLERGRIAILGKTHHALVDGVSGIDIASVMLDLTPDGSQEIPAPAAWTPAMPPTGYALAWSGVRDAVLAPKEAVDRARHLALAPAAAARRVAATASGVGSVIRRNLTGLAPRSPLNLPPGPHRRIATQIIALDDVKIIKNAYGTTVNDVVLAIVADATGRYLRHRGERTDGLRLKAMVPVSVRAEDQHSDLGNKVSSVFVSLPMYEMDPVERLRECHEAMREIKERGHAAGADFLINLTQFAPPTIHASASRLAARARLYNFLITNVPGPQIPIWCLGARLESAFPVVPLAPNQSYAVGLTSIDGIMSFGITADLAFEDIDHAADYLTAALDDLLASANAVDSRAELLAGN